MLILAAFEVRSRLARCQIVVPTFLALALLSPSLPGLHAQGAMVGSISGDIRLDDGTAASGAIVWLVGARQHAMADEAGRFTLPQVSAGVQQIEARSPLGSVTRAMATVSAGRETKISITLGRLTQQLTGVTVLAAASDALARVPGSFGVVTSEQLRGMQPFSANEALRTIPGVHLQEEEGMGLRANIGIRGLDPDRSRSVLVLEDGVPVSLAPYGEPELYYSPPIDRMARIEVIKGSGSIMFGPQTIGGVVNYVTADLPLRSFARATAQGGSGGTRLLKTEVGTRVGNVRAQINAFDRRAGDLNGLYATVRDVTAKLGWGTSVGDFGVKVSAYDESSNATYVGLTDSMFRASPFVHPQPDDQLDVARYAVTASHQRAVGGHGALRTSAYAYHTSRNWNRRDYTYGSTGQTHVFANTTGSRDRAFTVAGIEPRLRTSWAMGSRRHDLDAGVRAHLELTRDQHVNGRIDSEDRTIRDDERRTGRAMSAFVQNRFAITDALSITPGVRAESFSFERDVRRTRIRRRDGGRTVRAIEDVSLGGTDNVRELIPGIGVAYTPSEVLSIFGGAHRGFAPPRSKDALIFTDPTIDTNAQVPELVSLQLDAERSVNTEIGARLSPRPWLSLEATAFRLDFTNQIIEPSLSAGSTSDAQFANQGATLHAGAEMAGTIDVGLLLAKPWSLSLTGSVTRSDATFSRDRFIRAPGGDTVNVRGNVLPYAPALRGHAAITYTLPNTLVLRVDGIYVDAQFTDNFETRAGSANGRVGLVPAYAIFDASVRWTLPNTNGLSLTGSAKNIGDRTYIASRRPEGIKVGLPRLLTLGVSWGN